MSRPTSQPSPNIFISYRRSDSISSALHLFDNLSDHFGKDRVFMDIEQIEPGVDFVQVIEQVIDSCDVLLALIGQHWLTASDGTSRRLDDPDNLVRLEIVSALNQNVPVIPVLVQGAIMPGPHDLPPELVKLSRRNAFELSDRRWKHDVNQLIIALERILVRRREARYNQESEEVEHQRHGVEAGPQMEGSERHRIAEVASMPAEGATSAARSDASSSSIDAATRPDVVKSGKTEQSKKSKRALIICSVALLAVIGVALFRWLPAGKMRQEVTPTASQEQVRQQTESGALHIELVWIPPGSFMMGSKNGHDDEKPIQQVTISQGFYIGRYEVTQAQWQAVMGNNPSNFKGCDQCPVEMVSWEDAQEFIRRLNMMDDGYTYRLPSEAEWEYAARAGTTSNYAGDLDAMAWYGNNSGRKQLDAARMFQTDPQNYYKRISDNGGQPHPVGSKLPNAFGLFDMHGNVWEWCEDRYHDSYAGAPLDGSAWVSGGRQQERVLRGGSWYFGADFCRSAYRNRNAPDARYDSNGIRVAAAIKATNLK